MVVTDLLVEHFPEIVDVTFTATMEEDLDEIAVGHKDWPEVLRQFYDPFERLLEKKDKEITRDDLIKETTDEKCPKCDGPMHDQARPLREVPVLRELPGVQGHAADRRHGASRADEVPGEVCELCGSPMLLRHGRFGPFVGCSNYPECKYIKKETIGGTCPKCRDGQAAAAPVEEAATTFYGCTRYPDCDYVMGSRPLDDPCPKCGGTMAPDEERGGICQSCGHALQGDPVPPPVASRAVPTAASCTGARSFFKLTPVTPDDATGDPDGARLSQVPPEVPAPGRAARPRADPTTRATAGRSRTGWSCACGTSAGCGSG